MRGYLRRIDRNSPTPVELANARNPSASMQR